jgi:hypothetical protein
MAWRGMLAALALGLSACASPVTFFQCVDDSQCGAGTCEPNEYCSFPDEMCPSGRVYGDEAAPGIAGQCVPVVEGSSGAATTSDGTTSGSSGEGTTSAAPSSTSMDDGTTQAATFTSTSVGDSTRGTASDGDSSSSGIPGDCSILGEDECTKCALASVCQLAVEQCVVHEGCPGVIKCVETCQEDACVDECCSDITDETLTIYNDLVFCLVETCTPLVPPLACI